MRTLSLLALASICVLPTVARAEPLVGRWVTLRPSNYPQQVVRHRGFLGEITPLQNDLDKKDSSFKVVPGLAGGGSVSFEAANYPGYFLRHQDFRVKLAKSDGSDLFRKDASFTVTAGPAGGSTFHSVNYPDRVIRHCSFHLYIDNNDGSHKDCAPDAKTFAADQSFVVQSAAIGTRVALASVNYPDKLVRHCNYLGFLDNNDGATKECNPAAYGGDTTFVMVPSLDGSGGVSFESTNNPGQYLRHQDFRVKLAASDGSALFDKDASFTQVPGNAGSDVSFRSVNYPDRYLRHCSFKLFIDNGKGNPACAPDDATFKKDTTFKLAPR